MKNFSKIINTLILIKIIILFFSYFDYFKFFYYFYLLLPNNELVKDPINLQYLLTVDVILVLILLSLIIRQILLIFIYRKKNFDESKLYIKFINLFTAMALGPAIGIFIITSLFFN